ncbi:MAG: hypothetical protein M0R33_15595 [Methylomonas sp.]|jgi:hypothetical protein|uniref:hypothetical protein n=1 Tax=Methylomonas sp. TaxID=418 RepID=UPI0025CD83EE|nr:hypothetical protein [Methylomonas sp.]MCK9607867.1 hypothetical protein [Methylomonas sp.]
MDDESCAVITGGSIENCYEALKSAGVKSIENIDWIHRTYYKEWVDALDVVKTFIREKGLILYGGQAMDYALRTKGTKLYEDSAFPDFDFFSPAHFADAIELADILFMRGYQRVRVIRALYTRAMKIDIGDNLWVADIAYMPKTLFDNYPTIEYDGIRVIAPIVHRIDQHSSLTYPFDEAPREVVFHRWAKDIERFNILNRYFPISTISLAESQQKMTTILIPRALMGDSIAYGVFALALWKIAAQEEIKNEFGKSEFAEEFANIAADIAREDDVHLKLRSGIPCADIVTMNFARFVEEDASINRQAFLQFFGKTSANRKTRIVAHELDKRLMGECSVSIGEKKVRFASIQGILKYFIAEYVRRKYLAWKGDFESTSANVYLNYYLGILKIINAAETRYAAANKEKEFAESIFAPSIRVFGAENTSLAVQIAKLTKKKQLLHDETIKIPPLPQSPYIPRTAREKPIPFDYSSSEIFMESGELIQ